MKSYNHYLGKEISEQDFDGCIKPHHGLAFVNKAGNVNVKLMIEAWANYLKSKQSYMAAQFQYSRC
jgi:hypothetical protein